MPLNPDLREIGKLALLIHPRAELIATVNHFDNFKLWAAPIIDDAIFIAMNAKNDFEGMAEYLESGMCEQQTYHSYHADRNPAVIEIAREVHNRFQPQD